MAWNGLKRFLKSKNQLNTSLDHWWLGIPQNYSSQKILSLSVSFLYLNFKLLDKKLFWEMWLFSRKKYASTLSPSQVYFFKTDFFIFRNTHSLSNSWKIVFLCLTNLYILAILVKHSHFRIHYFMSADILLLSQVCIYYEHPFTKRFWYWFWSWVVISNCHCRLGKSWCCEFLLFLELINVTLDNS